MIDREGLADFLRRRREQVRPADVGLPEGGRRRTPGLRREEVAQLAGISADHYTRMEQARGSAPSEGVVMAVARALQCDLDQRDHLFHLVGLTPPERRSAGHLRPGLIDLAGRLTDVPVSIISDLTEPLWANALHVALMGQPAQETDYLIRRWFTDPSFRERSPREEWDRLSAAHVGDLRATYARRAGDRDVSDLVADLLKRSSEFRALWERHEVSVRRSDRKEVLHPELGRISLRCEVLLTPDADVELVALFPLEDTDAAEKLELLRVIGTQDFQPHPAYPG